MRRFGLAALCVLGVAGASAVAHADNARQAAARQPAAGGQCIAPASVQAATSCEIAGRSPRIRRGGKAPATQLRAVNRRAAAPRNRATRPGFEIDLATQMGRERIRARAWNLLQREVQLLQRLVRNTRRNNPQRPEILLRLAETYFEMQTAMNARVRGFDEKIFEHCTTHPNREKCKANRQGQRRAEARLTQVRQATNRTYATLVQDHPDFRDMDRVLFSLAFGLEQVRQHDQARQVYHKLIKGFPESRFIPNAYLSFAEYFFNDPQHTDMRAALRFYQKVVEFPPERNPVYGYAIYKSAWAKYNLEDFQGALEDFVRVIEFAEGNSNATDAENLARQARRELVIPYSRVGNPSRAFAFFQRYAKNRAGALEMLEALAELYFDTGKWSEAIATYHELMSLEQRSNRLCYWQSRVTNAVISSRQKSEQVEELGRLVRVYEEFMRRRGADSEAQLECKAETAGILVWLATSWHRETVGTSDSPGTMDRATMGQAAQLYTMLVERFPDMERLQFPNIRREDWPNRYRVQYYLAELLWKMEDWERCGPAFDDVVDLNPRGEFTEDAAYAAVLCYNNLYQTQYQGRERDARTDQGSQEASEEGSRRGRRGRRRGGQNAEQEQQSDARKYARRDLSRVEHGMVNAFTRYICVVDSDAQDLVQIKYRKARIFYEANHFEEAAVLFRDIALNHSTTEYGEFAANLYLDSLNVLGTMQEPKRPECIAELTQNIDPMAERFCATESDREAHGDICEVVGTLQCQANRALAESLQSRHRFREAAGKYVEMFRRNLQLPEDQRCGDMDESLWNAAINYEAARLLGRAIRVRQALVQQYPESPLAKKSIYLLGANFHALAYYEQAASFYEQFARKYPGETGGDCSEQERNEGRCPDAVLALRNATLFRLGLGQEEKAREDIQLFESNYRRSRGSETAQVAFALGALYEQREMWDHVIRYYRKFLRDYRRNAAPHQVVLANVAIGRALLKKDDPREARGAFSDAVRAWSRGAVQGINRMSGMSDSEKVFALRQALDATAEAMFRLAEDEYKAFRAIEFPAYTGGRSLERVNTWSNREFKPWVQKKLAALRAAEEQYNRIAALKVDVRGVEVNSPAWQIAAAARSGTMYREFVDHFRNAPIPNVIENDPDLYDVYAGALDEQSQPLLNTAKERFLFCLRTATNVRWFNEWSRQCESELNRLNPSQYPIAAELRGEPNYVHSRPARPGVVELGAAEPEENLGGQSGGQGQ